MQNRAEQEAVSVCTGQCSWLPTYANEMTCPACRERIRILFDLRCTPAAWIILCEVGV